MTPNPTPPWRLIEAPGDGASPTVTPTTPAPAAKERSAGLDPALVRTAAILAAAVALAVVAFILALTSGSGDGVVIDGNGANEFVASPSPGDTTGGTQDAGIVVVEVGGAVAHPGVFRLPTGSRVADVIEAAGGYGPRVDTTRVSRELNLAARVQDGDRVLVASRDDAVTATDTAGTVGREAGSGGTDGGLVDLNLATAEMLDQLPGVGPVTAAKILAAREEAPCVSVDDLRSRGILGEKTFERLRDLVAVP